MNIVRITGGLGNQMYQYAFYVSMREKGIECKLDVTELDNYLKKYGRDSIFNSYKVDKNFADSNDVYKLGGYKRDIISKIKRRVFGLKKTHYVYNGNVYNDAVYNMENTYFDGYWGNYKYFIDYLSIIREEFSLINELDVKNKKMLDMIETSKNSVSIHVRLGDAISNKKVYNNGKGIASVEYYNRAIHYINNRIEEPHYFVFSNEPNKALNYLNISNYTLVNINNEFDGYKDLFLMSKCKFNISGKSTFSYWASYLNKNNSKIVIVPKPDYNVNKNNIPFPSEWILL